jgi:hypothetical protein
VNNEAALWLVSFLFLLGENEFRRHGGDGWSRPSDNRCRSGMARPQAADGGDGLRAWKVDGGVKVADSKHWVSLQLGLWQ